MKVLFCLMQRERREQYGVGGAVVQTATGIHHIVQHPCRCTAADNQFDVSAISSPVIPEVLQCTDEFGSVCVKPR